MTRLTEPGCCVQPFWTPDGRIVLFIDKPGLTSESGIYGVSIGGGEPTLISERVGLPSPDGHYMTYLNEDGETVVEEVSSREQSIIPNGGLRVFFSPGSKRLAWAEIIGTSDFDRRRIIISVSDLNGENATELITVFGGGIVGWLDDDHLLLVGATRLSPDLSLFSLSVTDGERFDLVRNHRIYSASIAPGGQWVLYTIALGPDMVELDGFWVISADAKQHYKLETVGSAHWRDGTHLLIIPIEPDAPSHRLWQFDALTGEVEPLTDPEQLPFRVAAGDWSVSPTGEHVVFLNAEDQALWLITLPPVETPED